MPETTVHAPPSFAALLWLLAGYGALLVWYLLRRDAGPEARTAPVTPRWRPPEGLSPAAIAWLGGYLDGTGIVLRRALAAALADLAMKGHLRIDV
ncbi:MAG TPA: DUF2207 domain-containing protein, partial [Thermopetrobacter sp.]|nr:DUF2207 domain-containing protein [Thermopetrobacter sp.]